jgi:hypothetical protein
LKIVCNVEANALGTESLLRLVESRAKPKRAGRRSRPLKRNIVAIFAVLTFFLQGLITQSHIHGPSLSGVTVSASTARAGLAAVHAATSLDRDQTPGTPTDDPAHCPICQEFLLSGAYFAPIAPAIPLPFQVATIVPPTIAPIAIVQTVSHIWRGRGPPLD